MIRFIFIFLGVAMAQDWKDLQDFRQGAEESIKKNWLVVVGLDWLQEGRAQNWPADKPIVAFELKNKKVSMKVLDEKDLKVDGQSAQKGKTYVLLPDTSNKKTVIEKGSVQIFVIERAKGLGLRIKDTESPAVKAFAGLKWFDPKKEYVIQGRWKDLKPERVIKIPDIQGEISEEKISGFVEFELAGQKQQLYPTKEGTDLFFVFKDLTSGKTSYGPGRFLRADLKKDGTVIMDFNRATNPPCAFISFATCPLPPIENYMKVAVEAGALKPEKGH